MKERWIAVFLLAGLLVSCGGQPVVAPPVSTMDELMETAAPVASITPLPTSSATPQPTETLATPLLPLAPFTRIAAGGFHVCAITSAGGVQCWGYNRMGQLGTGRNTDRNLPANVVGLSEDVTAVGAGWYVSCAITRGGALKCWGVNLHGELGDGSTVNRNVPTDVIGLDHGVAAISGGFNHTCALTESGAVHCWGDNTFGQLGDGSRNSSTRPVDVAGLDRGVVSIEAGMFHTCALLETGGVECWGMRNKIGGPSPADSALPVQVLEMSGGAKEIAAGSDHTCAIMTDDAIKCWGDSRQGAMGVRLDDGGNSVTWVRMPNAPSNLAGIAAGGYNTCGILIDGGLACWGSNENHSLGKEPYGKQFEDRKTYTPVGIAGLSGGVQEVAIGSGFMCALLTDGRIQCWGSNSGGVLGYGGYDDAYTPVLVRGFEKPED